jgi:mono/diheme cytochrome c family protein
MRCFVWAVPLTLTAVTLAQAGHEFDGRDLTAGAELYAENCASCHGAKLEGQPNWRVPDENGVLPAPPHDKSGHTWHHSSQQLFDYTKFGGQDALLRMGVAGFASGMPGFADALSDQQIWEILAFIASTWPEREAAVQADRSAGH